MTHRRVLSLSKAASAGVAMVLLLLVATRLSGQAPSLTLLSADGRRAMPIVVLGGRDFVALDELATTFGLTVREEAGAVTVSTRNGTIVLNPDQPLVSIAGRVVSLPAAPVRSSGRLLVPLDFISRALASIHDTRMELRSDGRLLILGSLRVPRVVIGQEGLESYARITIDTTPRTDLAVTQDADRLVVRFEADALDLSLPDTLPAGFVRGIRAIDAATLAIDLGPRFAAFRETPQAPDSPRRVFDLLSLNADAGAPTGPAATPETAVTTTTAALPDFSEPEIPLGTVVIDPGHGGEDVGVKGSRGTLEKDVTLSIARRLESLLEGGLGVRVLLTRDDDRAAPLDRRTAVANNNKADVFISLHANASPRASATGASVRTAAFDPGESARASLAAESLPAVGGRMRDLNLVRWDLAQVRHVERSQQLASFVARQLAERVPMDPHPVSGEPLRVLEAANMPAVVVEIGYLTNPEQERQMASGDFQGRIAQALFDALLEFRAVLGDGGER